MMQILTLTLNPALDLATTVPEVIAGPKLRCAAPSAEPGGGGVNVSRAIAHLGGASLAAVALAGATGETLQRLMHADGLKVLPLPAPGETRMSFAVTDKAGAQYRFVLPGPVWTKADVDAMLTRLNTLTDPRALVVLSGSLPPGVPADLPAQLMARLGPQRRLVVDTSGDALTRLASGADAGVEVLRMDSSEAEALAGQTLPARIDSARFAERLRKRGAAQAVIIARGADGSVLAEPGGLWHVTAVDVPVRSRIGAGDSFVGGLALGLAREERLHEALRLGAACASAAVMTDGTELCRRADVDSLLPQTAVSGL